MASRKTGIAKRFAESADGGEGRGQNASLSSPLPKDSRRGGIRRRLEEANKANEPESEAPPAAKYVFELRRVNQKFDLFMYV